MKLSALHKSTARDIVEGIDPSQHEKIAYLQLMISRQGKDPEPTIKRIRGMIDPSFAKSEGFKSTFKNWVQGAQPNDTRDGRAYGRKIKVTVLESAARYVIHENIFSDLGQIVLSKIKSLMGDDPQEHKMVSGALDEFPQLAWIHRYARKSEQPIYDDEAFWKKVNDTTNGLGQKIKAMLDATYRRLEETRKTNPSATILSECVVMEAKISQVMGSLGLEPQAIQSIMGDAGLRDEDYDLSRLKELYEKGAGAVKSGVQAIKGAPAAAASKIKSQADVSRVSKQNVDYADQIVLTAAFLLKAAEEVKAGASPEQAVQTAQDELQYGESETIKPGPDAKSAQKPAAPQAPAQKPNEVSVDDLNLNS